MARSLWKKEDWRLRVLLVAIIAASPAVVGLLLYASTRAWWIGPDDRVLAIVAAALLGAGATAALAGRTVGLFIMFSSACASLGLATESLFRLTSPHITWCGLVSVDRSMLELSLVAFVPGAIAALAATAVLSPAMVRFVKTRTPN